MTASARQPGELWSNLPAVPILARKPIPVPRNAPPPPAAGANGGANANSNTTMRQRILTTVAIIGCLALLAVVILVFWYGGGAGGGGITSVGDTSVQYVCISADRRLSLVIWSDLTGT